MCAYPPSRHHEPGMLGAVGDTPLLYLAALSARTQCTVLAKAEFLNPGGSSKDRIAKGMIEEAEREELLRGGGTIYEATTGSTGSSLALVAAAKGYNCRLFMPIDTAPEKIRIAETLGAIVELAPSVAIVDANHYVRRAEAAAAQDLNGFYANQFENPINTATHYKTTGPELWRQSEGKIDAFVMGAGTGGTIAGVSAYLKERSAKVKAFLVDPPGSGLYNYITNGVCFSSTDREGTRKREQVDSVIEGVGCKRLTRNFLNAVPFIDGAFQCSDEEAVEMCHFLLKHEGLFVGASSGMHCVGVLRVAQLLGPGHTIVTILSDGGQRYMSKIFSHKKVNSSSSSVT